jgi:hypothetical protein
MALGTPEHYGVWDGQSEADRSRRTGGDAVAASS